MPARAVLTPAKQYRLQPPPKNNLIDTLPDRKPSISQPWSVFSDSQMDQKWAVFCIKSRIRCAHRHIFTVEKKYMVCADRCLSFLLSLPALFQLQVLAEVVLCQVCTFSHLHRASEVLWRNCFYSETEICWREISFNFIHELYIFPLNYRWYGFLKAANDKRFLWLWSFLSKQSGHRSKWAHPVCKILHCK